jgi:hypothetical protein
MIKNLRIVALSAALPLATLSSAYGAVSLNFNLSDLSTFGPLNSSDEQILNYYNGGADQGGAIGPNYGISFGADALAQINYPGDPAGTSNVGNEPDGGDASMVFYSGSGDLMNVAAGFKTGFSFYYSAPFYAGSVNVYSGLNGTGTLLASLSLATTPNAASSPYNLPYNYGVWDPIGVSFAGTAESVNFSGSAGYIAFADVTLGSVSPVVSSVPDNTGASVYMLAGLGLGAAAWASRKRGMITA